MAVTQTVAADLLTPLSAYLRIARGAEYSFLLESVEGGEHLARYSFLGAGPHAVVRGRGDGTRGGRRTAPRVKSRARPSTFCGANLLRARLAAAEGTAPMAGGCVGYLGYSAARWFDSAMKIIEGPGDDALFLLFRTVLAFDHARQQLQVRTAVSVDGAAGDAARLRALYESALAENRDVVARLAEAIELPLADPMNGSAGEAVVDSNFTRAEFEHAVREVKELIAAGECYQTVISQRFRIRSQAEPVALYRALRMTNPSPYMFLLRLGEESLIGASPEMLVRCRGRELCYRPIAGTRPRGANEAEDLRLAQELLADEKERAEHMMLVDLGRNDLGRVAEYGSVKVDKLMTVEKYSHVQHLVTELSAQLRDGLDRFDALGACFPAGTVTGAPKIRSMQAIAELERGTRACLQRQRALRGLRRQSRFLHRHPHHGGLARRGLRAGRRGHRGRLRPGARV